MTMHAYILSVFTGIQVISFYKTIVLLFIYSAFFVLGIDGLHKLCPNMDILEHPSYLL